MARDAVINIEARVADAQEDVNDLSQDLRETETDAEVLQNALQISASTTQARGSVNELGKDIRDTQSEVRALRRSLKVLGQTDANPDVDVDRDGGFGGRSRIPTEPEDAVRLFAGLPPQLKALTVAAGGAAAALGAGAGLAGVATALAAQFGDQGIQQELDSVRFQFRGVANEISDEFEPVIRQQVIPAAEALATKLSGAADNAAQFSSAALEIIGFEAGQESEQSRIPAQASARLAASGVETSAVSTIGLEQTGVARLSDRVRENVREVRGFNQSLQEGIQKQRQKLEGVRFAADQLNLTREEELQQVIKIRKQIARTAAAKARANDIPLAAVDLQSGEGTKSIFDVVDEVERLQQKLQQVQRPIQTIFQNFQDISALREPGIVEPPNAPSVRPGGSQLGRTGIERDIARGSRRAEQRLPSQEALQERMVRAQTQAQEAGKAIEQGVNRNLTQGIQLASQLGSTLVQSAREGSLTFQSAFSSILGVVGSIVGTVNPVAGAALGGAGQLVGSFAEGGRVDTPLQVVGERGPELAALPQGTEVSSTQDSRKALGTDVLAQKMDTLIQRMSTLEVSISASETEQSVSTVQAEEERMGARVYRPTS